MLSILHSPFPPTLVCGFLHIPSLPLYTILPTIYNTSHYIQHFRLYTILPTIYNTSHYIQYFSLYTILHTIYNTSYYIQYFPLYILLQPYTLHNTSHYTPSTPSTLPLFTGPNILPLYSSIQTPHSSGVGYTGGKCVCRGGERRTSRPFYGRGE